MLSKSRKSTDTSNIFVTNTGFGLKKSARIKIIKKNLDKIRKIVEEGLSANKNKSRSKESNSSD